MLPTHFLYRAVTGRVVAPGELSCCLCGSVCAESVPVETVIRDTFTNHGLCRAPHSRAVCLACDHYFNTRWTPHGFKKQAEYRMLSLRVCADGFQSWQRSAMRRDINRWLSAGCPECLLVVSLAKKKHLVPLSRVNVPGSGFAVQVEEECVWVHPAAWGPLALAFDRLLELGIGKGNILSGAYHPASLRKVDVAESLRLDRSIAPWRPSGLLTLLSYVTLVEEDGADAAGEPDAETGDRRNTVSAVGAAG